MANQISVTGNLGADPRVNVGDFGTVLNFGLAYRPRKKDKQSGEWVDAGPTL
jgi:single-stranded DNA-binding protein